MSGGAVVRKLTPEVKERLDREKRAKRRALGELAKNHRAEYQSLVAKHLKVEVASAEVRAGEDGSVVEVGRREPAVVGADADAGAGEVGEAAPGGFSAAAGGGAGETV